MDFTDANAAILSAGIPVIVTVGVMSQGRLLTGRRRDNGLWTSPGGHMDAGEMPLEAARREVLEESGIDLTMYQLTQVGAERIVSHRTGKEFAVLVFVVDLPDVALTTIENDPDNEISVWKWVPISASTPELHPNMRHAKVDSILVHLGLWPEEGKMELQPHHQAALEEVMKAEPVLTLDRRFMEFVHDRLSGSPRLRARTMLEKKLSQLADAIAGAAAPAAEEE